MNNVDDKLVYQTPEIEVIEVCVEGVIASSNERMEDIAEENPWDQSKTTFL